MPRTIDDLDVKDSLYWNGTVYRVADVGDHVSDVEGVHARLTLRSPARSKYDLEEVVLHERLINRWFENRSERFYLIRRGRSH